MMMLMNSLNFLGNCLKILQKKNKFLEQCQSHFETVKIAMPQGSVLGPIQFLVGLVAWERSVTGNLYHKQNVTNRLKQQMMSLIVCWFEPWSFWERIVGLNFASYLWVLSGEGKHRFETCTKLWRNSMMSVKISIRTGPAWESWLSSHILRGCQWNL